MSTSVAVIITVLIAVFGMAFVVARLLQLRAGLRKVPAAAEIDTSELDLSRTGPTVVHFSAAWCGPCAGVRRVVNQVCEELPAVTHIEIDMDSNPTVAQRLSVLSLPTTVVFDADGRLRYRTAGVPTVADLRSVLEPLLA